MASTALVIHSSDTHSRTEWKFWPPAHTLGVSRPMYDSRGAVGAAADGLAFGRYADPLHGLEGVVEDLGILADLVGHVAVGLRNLDRDLRLREPFLDVCDYRPEVVLALVELFDRTPAPAP